jgi:hypothetical protein
LLHETLRSRRLTPNPSGGSGGRAPSVNAQPSHTPGRAEAHKGSRPNPDPPCRPRAVSLPGISPGIKTGQEGRLSARAAAASGPTGKALANTASALFKSYMGELNRAAEADPEPVRTSPFWVSWFRRHCEREGLRTEIREAEGLTRDERDPAPLASCGLEAFLTWSRRQELRRTSGRTR